MGWTRPDRHGGTAPIVALPAVLIDYARRKYAEEHRLLVPGSR